MVAPSPAATHPAALPAQVVDDGALSTGGAARPGETVHAAPVRAIEVEPAALPSAADRLLRFAAEVDWTPGLPALPMPLAEAVAELVRATAHDVAELGAQAMQDGRRVLAAADLYRRLEALLVPESLR